MNKQRRRRWQRKRQKSNRFYISKTTTLLISGFFVHFLAVVHDYNLKVPNFKFCRGREHKTTTTFFFSWPLIQSFRSQLRKNLPTFDELTEMVWTRSSLREGPGGPPPICRPNWGPKGPKKIFFRQPPPPFLRVWMTASHPLLCYID